MQWQPDTAFLRGLDFFSEAVSGLGEADWQRASPCQGWRALDVLGHVGQATRFGTLLLQGVQPDWSPVEPPGVAVEGSPGPWWQGLADQARDAVTGVDISEVVDSPRGRRSIGEGLSFPALDLFVHGWDVGKSAGLDMVLPGEAVEFARSVLEPLPAGQLRKERRLFRQPRRNLALGPGHRQGRARPGKNLKISATIFSPLVTRARASLVPGPASRRRPGPASR